MENTDSPVSTAIRETGFTPNHALSSRIQLLITALEVRNPGVGVTQLNTAPCRYGVPRRSNTHLSNTTLREFANLNVVVAWGGS